ncbi:unnamed protein product, partial [Callosobruchus maculatus]
MVAIISPEAVDDGMTVLLELSTTSWTEVDAGISSFFPDGSGVAASLLPFVKASASGIICAFPEDLSMQFGGIGDDSQSFSLCSLALYAVDRPDHLAKQGIARSCPLKSDHGIVHANDLESVSVDKFNTVTW